MTLPIPARGTVAEAITAHDTPPDLTAAAAFREVLSLALGSAHSAEPRPPRRNVDRSAQSSDAAEATPTSLGEGASTSTGEAPPAFQVNPGASQHPPEPPRDDTRSDTPHRAAPTSGTPTSPPESPVLPGSAPRRRRDRDRESARDMVAPTTRLDALPAVAALVVPPLSPAPDIAPVSVMAASSTPRAPEIAFDVASLPTLMPTGEPLPADATGERPRLPGLRPEFATRLERVIDRMQSEFGVRVQVVETVRSPERQEALYAQGRTAPGPIVTWTRASKHLQGLAADLTLNGGWTDNAAFQRLAIVAQQEGLRTLGPRDPGHIELPTGATATTVAQQPTSDRAPIPAAPRPDVPLGRMDGTRAGVDLARPIGATPPRREPEVRTQPIVWPRVPDEDAPEVSLPVIRERQVLRRESGTRVTPVAERPTDILLPDVPAAERVSPPMARVARVAPVAAVASPAPVARVANVAVVEAPADVGATVRQVVVTPTRRAERQSARTSERTREVVAHAAPAPAPSTARTILPAPVAEPVAPWPVVTNDSAHAERPARDAESRQSSREGTEGRDAVAVMAERGESPSPSSSSPLERGRDAGAGAPGSVERVERSDAAERIARVMRLQDAQPERPMSSVTLRLDHPDGGEDRIRIDLRGHSVGATMEVRETAVANQLLAHAGELREALEQRGLEGEVFTVRATARPQEPVAGAAVLAGEREAIRTQAGGSSSFDTSSRDQRSPARGDDGSRHQDQASARQRRDQRGHRA